MPKLLAIVGRPWAGMGPAGGAETMIHDLCNYVGWDWDVKAINLNETTGGAQQLGNVIIAPNRADILREAVSEADVIISHLTAVPEAFRIANGKPFVQIIHNNYPKFVREMRPGMHFVFNSHWLKRHFNTFSGPVVHPPALQEPKLLANRNGSVTLINLCKNKGPDVFYWLSRNLPSNQFLGVMGGYLPNKQDVRRWNNVSFHPFTDNIDEVYSKTAILIVPSVYESYGRVAVEAMSRGIPVIASDTPGLRESIGSGGICLPRGNLIPWKNAIKNTFSFYSERSEMALDRYDELMIESEQELAEFAAYLEGLC